jgi:hypothetical protein
VPTVGVATITALKVIRRGKDEIRAFVVEILGVKLAWRWLRGLLR